jgi:hypothetical protein
MATLEGTSIRPIDAGLIGRIWQFLVAHNETNPGVQAKTQSTIRLDISNFVNCPRDAGTALSLAVTEAGRWSRVGAERAAIIWNILGVMQNVR